MEGQVTKLVTYALLISALTTSYPGYGASQERSGAAESDTGTAEISLRKAIEERVYKGQTIAGDQREIRSGDSLWRILVKEKRLEETRFHEYVVLIRGLNPQLKTPDMLRIGDKIFIPLKPQEALGLTTASITADNPAPKPVAQGATRDYTVKSGDHLYQILRAQLGILEERKLAQYFALVKDLNPQKSNWDVLERGETIRLPVTGVETENNVVADAAAAPAKTKSAEAEPIKAESQVAKLPPAPSKPTPPPAIGLDYARRLPARENFALLGMVAESLGNELQRSGEEVVALKDTSVRLDKDKFPVVYNRALDQRVVLDAENKIPDSLRADLKQQSSNMPVVSVTKNTTVQEAVGELLARLGFQPLPAERPVIIYDGGISFEAKGQWAVMAPEQSHKPQEIIVVNLTDGNGTIPEDLAAHLMSKGLNLKTVSLAEPAAKNPEDSGQQSTAPKGQLRKLPQEKSEMVDALLLAYQVPFGVKENFSVELHSGLRVDIAADRTFESRGRKTALFFRRIDPAVKAALKEKHKTQPLELDLAALKSRDVVARLLAELGEKVAYKDHRFSAANGSLQDRLVITAAGFHLPSRSLFVTDREIPARVHRVFFEKGLDIVYFQ